MTRWLTPDEDFARGSDARVKAWAEWVRQCREMSGGGEHMRSDFCGPKGQPDTATDESVDDATTEGEE